VYEASAWFWADGVGPTGPFTAAVQQLKIEFYDAAYGDALAKYTTEFSGVGETWQQVSVVATAPVGTVWSRYVVSVEGASSAGALQFDDARLVRLP
jgi:hypothetical protein